MPPTLEEIRARARAFILEEFLPGEDPNELEDTTPLITGGILDSIATVKVVAHLEELYGIEFEAHDVAADHFDTIAQMAQAVSAKLGAA